MGLPSGFKLTLIALGLLGQLGQVDVVFVRHVERMCMSVRRESAPLRRTRSTWVDTGKASKFLRRDEETMGPEPGQALGEGIEAEFSEDAQLAGKATLLSRGGLCL